MAKYVDSINPFGHFNGVKKSEPGCHEGAVLWLVLVLVGKVFSERIHLRWKVGTALSKTRLL